MHRLSKLRNWAEEIFTALCICSLGTVASWFPWDLVWTEEFFLLILSSQDTSYKPGEFNFFKLENNWFTVLYQFLLYSIMIESYIYVHSFSHIIFYPGLSQETEYSSLCYTVVRHCHSFFFFFVFDSFRAEPVAYGGSQVRGLIGAVAYGLCHSHSNARSKLHLWPTPQLMATLDP